MISELKHYKICWYELPTTPKEKIEFINNININQKYENFIFNNVFLIWYHSGWINIKEILAEQKSLTNYINNNAPIEPNKTIVLEYNVEKNFYYFSEIVNIYHDSSVEKLQIKETQLKQEFLKQNRLNMLKYL